jgi:hypothetical protein
VTSEITKKEVVVAIMIIKGVIKSRISAFKEASKTPKSIKLRINLERVRNVSTTIMHLVASKRFSTLRRLLKRLKLKLSQRISNLQ